MSTAEPVLFEVDADGVALITLNRPDKLNACSGGMLTRLAELYRRCDEDDAVRAVVVTGSGRAFCTGADMTDAARTFDVSNSGGFEDFSAAGVEFPAFRVRKLVVAAVNGHAIGLGHDDRDAVRSADLRPRREVRDRAGAPRCDGRRLFALDGRAAGRPRPGGGDHVDRADLPRGRARSAGGRERGRSRRRGAARRPSTSRGTPPSTPPPSRSRSRSACSGSPPSSRPTRSSTARPSSTSTSCPPPTPSRARWPMSSDESRAGSSAFPATGPSGPGTDHDPSISLAPGG